MGCGKQNYYWINVIQEDQLHQTEDPRITGPAIYHLETYLDLFSWCLSGDIRW